MAKNPVARPSRAASTRRTTLSVGLQMVIRFCHERGWFADRLAEHYEKADATARSLLAAPFGAASQDFADAADSGDGNAEAITFLTEYFRANAHKYTIVSPEDAAEEIVRTLTYQDRDAGFRLGLCVGYRLAHEGKDGTR